MRKASAPARPCGFVRARTWQPSTSNGLPSAMATMSMLAPMFFSVCSGKKCGSICPSRIPSSIDEPGAAEDVELLPGEDRHEEGEALDVVPVRVREQDARLAAPLAERALHQR